MRNSPPDPRQRRLTTVFRWLLVASEFGFLLFSGGCVDRLCYDVGIDSRGKYRADLIEVYNAQSTFVYEPGIGWSNGTSKGPCAGTDGLMAATSLELQGTGMTDDRTDTCELNTADLVSAPAPIQLLGPSSDPVPSARHSLVNPSCMRWKTLRSATARGRLGWTSCPVAAQAEYSRRPRRGRCHPRFCTRFSCRTAALASYATTISSFIL
jgi:hypothetical protein